MTKVTALIATVFLGLSLALSIMRSKQVKESIFDNNLPLGNSAPAAAVPAPQSIPQASKEAVSVESKSSPEAPPAETKASSQKAEDKK